MPRFAGLFERRRNAAPSSADTGRPIRRATVGLDFGTSTTKVCVLDEAGDGTRQPVVVAFDRSGLAPTPFFETKAARRGDFLLFGPEADDLEDARRSFKMCLPCQTRGRAANGEPCPRCDGQAGRYVLDDLHLDASELCALHLAVVLSEVLPAVPAMLDGPDAEWRIHINMGSPLDRVGKAAELKMLAEQVVDRAVRMAREPGVRPSRRWRIDDCRAALASVPVRDDLDPSDQSRMTSVYPETHAAMNALLHQRGRGNGLFALIDVGAGTTDMSFLWLQRSSDGTDRYWTYATGTLERGMDDVDRLLDARGLAAIRSDPRLRDDRLARIGGESRSQFRSLQRLVYRQFNRLMHEAKSRDVPSVARTWVSGKLSPAVLLVGGGSACHRFRAPLDEEVPTDWSCDGWAHPIRRLALEDSPAVWIVGGSTPCRYPNRIADVRELHVIAHGLARRRVDIPDIREVEPAAPVAPATSACSCQGRNDGCGYCGGLGWRNG